MNRQCNHVTHHVTCHSSNHHASDRPWSTGMTAGRRRQATALFVSALIHVLVLMALLTAGFYPSRGLDTSLDDAVFISCSMELYETPSAPAARSGATGRGRTRKPITEKTAPAQLSTPNPAGRPDPVETPLSPAAGPIVQSSGESDPTEGAIASLYGAPANGNGSAHGGGGQGNSGGMGSSHEGAGGSGSGDGVGAFDIAGGNGREERRVGANGAPSLVILHPPVYPTSARSMGKEGKVLLSMLIDAAGRLIEAHVIEKAGYGFDEAALEAVRLSLFKPAVKNGLPISCRARIAIRFRLKTGM